MVDPLGTKGTVVLHYHSVFCLIVLKNFDMETTGLLFCLSSPPPQSEGFQYFHFRSLFHSWSFE
jgi:hypothetical protein